MKSKLLASHLANQNGPDFLASLRADDWLGSGLQSGFAGTPAPQNAVGPVPQNAVPPTIQLSASGVAYTQNFDTLSNTAGSTTNALTIDGWTFTETGTSARVNQQYAVDTGGSNTGDAYSYGSTASTDRALGQLRSGTIVTTIGASFTNNTGSTITSLAISYDGEQWRFGGTHTTNDKLDFQISFTATSVTDATPGAWTDVDLLDFLPPITSGAASALDGNAAANRVANISTVLSSLSIANGATFWIRWLDVDAIGGAGDDGLAIDNFSITPTAAAALPVLSIDNVTMSEGDAGTVTFFFTVSLSAPAGPGGVTFDIATADGTAQDDNPGAEDNDYVAQSLTGQTIPAGSSTYSFQVTVNGDNAPEPNETFFVNVTNVTGATVGDGQGQGTINNDDTPGTLAIGDVTLAEGNTGTTSFSFTVTRSGGSEGAVGATWTLNAPGGAGNADAADFDAGQLLTGSVAFADGDTSETITILVKGDALVEPDEGFTVTLSSPTGGATITDDTGAGTVTNDDSPPIASIADTSVVEGDDGVTYLVFTVTLDHASNDPVSYDYQTANGTAAEDSDYLGVTGQISFAPGETSQTISIPVIGDDAPENNETLTVTLSNPSGGTIGDGVATGTITNDDGASYYSLAGGSFSQNWTNTGQITANDNWSGVPYIIGYLGDIDGGSTTNVDARTLTGANLGAIDVIANLANTTSNSGGVGEFHIADPVVGLQGSGTADAPSLVLYMDASGRTGVRLQANLRDVDSSAPGGIEDNSAQQINVQYRTDPNGAWTNVPGGYFPDATALGASQVTALDVTLPAGADNAATLEIRIMTTNAAGNDEWVGIDDIIVSSQVSPPSLSIANAAVIEGDAGPTIITFTVTRAGDSAGAVTADWTAVFGVGPYDAESDDFTPNTPLAGQVSFADGETSTTVTLSVDGDIGPEVDENFTITLSNPSGATIADGTATGTIVNDDGPPPLVTINDVTVTEGDSGTVLMTFTVTRTGGTGAFSVDWETADGTATAGSDYVSNSGTINFAVGQMSDAVTVAVTVNGDTESELSETLRVLLSNPTDFAVVTDGEGIGTIASDDPIFIHDIQGTAYFSPILAGEGIASFNVATAATVIVRAVVTALDNDGPRQGFYLQEELADWDANPFTSEGIFVFTGATVSGVAVGDIVTVTAHVMEYQGFASNMPVTTLTGPTSIVVNSTGNVLPAATLGAMPTAIMTLVQPDYTDSADGVGDSFDASLYALSYWETVEGMLVTMPDVVVADGFVTTSGGQPIFQAYSQSLTDADQINSRGGLTIAGDPPVGPPDTVGTEDDTIAGGRHLSDGDVNPDLVEIDFTGFAIDAPAGLTNSASMGDYLGDVTGIIDFDFTDRKLFVTDIDPGSFVDNTTTQESTALGNDSRALTVATFNVENLDPGDGAARFTAIALAIANNLNAPDIICIEEMQDNNGATASGGADASTTWQMLVTALNLATGSNYQWVDQEPNGSEGGEPGGNIRVGFLYNTDRVQLGTLDANASLADRRMYTDRIGDGVRDAGDLIDFSDDMLGTEIQTGDWSGTRRSLLGEFTFNGNTVYVTANHFPAKGGSDEFWQSNQNPATGEPTNAGWTQRNNVAQDVYAMLDLIEAGAPGVGIASGGDYNDFYFYRPMTTVTGYTMADGSARVGGSRFDNLTLTLTEAERYTYNFDGRSQAIDHIIVNGTLSAVATYDVVHLNTGFNASDPTPLSDHDPGLSSFNFRDFSEYLTGTGGAELIDGFGGNDTILGLGGNDLLVGGVGIDNMFGGAGDDAYGVDNAADVVNEVAGEGRDIVYSLVSYQLAAGAEVEILSAFDQSGTAPLVLLGNGYGQEIYGNQGANFIEGAGGADYLIGLGGNDVYVVDGNDDVIVEAVGGGTDAVFTRDSYTLSAGAEVEILSAVSHDATTPPVALIGNGFDQIIFGNAGINFIEGGGGADTLVGLGGDDIYVVDNAGDYVAEGAGGGRDVVYARASFALNGAEEVEILSTVSRSATAAIDLSGNDIANEIYGNDGANVLNGGLGADYLVGYGGADIFAFTTALGGGNVDAIADFLSGTDTIALDDAVFAGLAPGDLNPNAFVIGTAAQDADDRIVYDQATGALWYDADGNGAGAAVRFATLDGQPIVAASDFTVI
jgi:predicted extracellular nuclease